MDSSVVFAIAITIGVASTVAGTLLAARRNPHAVRSVAWAWCVVATGLSVAFVIGPRACCYLWPLVFAHLSLVISAAIFAAAIRLSAHWLRATATILIATALSGFYWSMLVTPASMLNESTWSAIRYLDFLPAAFARFVLPTGWMSGLHSFFWQGTYCFPGPIWWETMRYYRAGVPAYVIVLYLPALVRAGVGRPRISTSNYSVS